MHDRYVRLQSSHSLFVQVKVRKIHVFDLTFLIRTAILKLNSCHVKTIDLLQQRLAIQTCIECLKFMYGAAGLMQTFPQVIAQA